MTFEESWPAISRRLERLLVARRVPEAQLDDVVQETGIRLFRAWDRLDPDRGAWGLARAIALHAVADEVGAQRHHQQLDLVDLVDGCDTERTGIARFRLSSVGRALDQMAPRDRQVLLTEIGAAEAVALGGSALKMARRRARQRLRAIVERPGSWAGWILRWPLDLFRRSHSLRSQAFLSFGEGATGAFAALTAIAVFCVGPSGSGSTAPAERPRQGSGIGFRTARSEAALAVAAVERGRPAPDAHDGEASPAFAGDANSATPQDTSEDQWLRENLQEDAGYARQDIEDAKEDGETAGEDAKELAGHAEEDGEQAAQDAQQLPEDLRP